MTSSFSIQREAHSTSICVRDYVLAQVVRSCFVSGIGAYDPKKYSAADILRVAFLNNDALLMDEDNQVHGFVTILDFRQARVHSIESLLSRENKMHP